MSYARWWNLCHILVNYFECMKIWHEWWVFVISVIYNRFIAASAVIVKKL